MAMNLYQTAQNQLSVFRLKNRINNSYSIIFASKDLKKIVIFVYLLTEQMPTAAPDLLCMKNTMQGPLFLEGAI